MTRSLCVMALCLLALCISEGTARAWVENHVLGDDVTISVEATGKAVVEHRLKLKVNGSVRQHRVALHGVDRDAVPLGDCYLVPARDAVSSSLDSAIPLRLEVQQHHPRAGSDGLESAAIIVNVDDRKGLWRSTYVLVLRYRTDLRARGLVERDGAMVRVRWRGPVYGDGFDNARVTFVVPASKTPPRPVDSLVSDGAGPDDSAEASYLSEVRRGGEHDEIELLRTYLPVGEVGDWAVRVDQRAVAAPARPAPLAGSQPVKPPALGGLKRLPIEWRQASAALLFLVITLLVWMKGRTVTRLAAEANAIMPPVAPLPVPVRAVLAAICTVAAVALQLSHARPLAGAACIVLACLLAAHGAARSEARATLRGPGRWLNVTEREALGPVPSPRSSSLDVSTRRGKALLLTLLAALGVGVWLLARDSARQATLVALDAAVLLAIFGTGKVRALPPDCAVEPARLLRKLVRQLRKRPGMGNLRLVPRIRIPQQGVDPDELRLLVAPRRPLRGFTSIEVGVAYAIGTGAHVAMPEVLLRVVADSPCERAVAPLTRYGRSTPGRKADERVIAFVPRFPTVKATCEITAALAAKVVDTQALAASPVTADRRLLGDMATGASTGSPRAA